MATAMRSVRQEQRQVSERLRAEHRTWPEVAAEFCERYRVNVRAALRMVRDWSQRDAADEWNKRWPDDPKTFKNFSSWELWPGPTGHAPSLGVLGRLAELYECSIADLVGDCADFRTRDAAYRDVRQMATLPTMLGQGGAEPDLQELLTRLELTDVQELARLTSAWSERLGAATSRRSLLLKLSAALSMAAAAPAAAADPDNDLVPTTATVDGDLSGIWHSRYTYYSSGRDKSFEGEHYVVLRHVGDRLFGKSLPAKNRSRLRLDFLLNGSVGTGTWSERTSPTGYYRGAVYHGAIQVVLDPLGKAMRGRWIGFNREFHVNSDAWELDWIEEYSGKSARRTYEFKA